ncbi:ADP-ribosyltransferase, partial [Chromobacterium piscinae]
TTATLKNIDFSFDNGVIIPPGITLDQCTVTSGSITFSSGQVTATQAEAIAIAEGESAIATAATKGAVAYANAYGAVAYAIADGAVAYASKGGAEAYATEQGAVAYADFWSGAKAYNYQYGIGNGVDNSNYYYLDLEESALGAESDNKNFLKDILNEAINNGEQVVFSEAEKRAIGFYTGSRYSKDLNYRLRNGIPLTCAQQIHDATLQGVFKSGLKIVKTFRGCDKAEKEQLSQGEKFISPVYLSTSRNLNTARSFSGLNNGEKHETVVFGVSGLDVSTQSSYPLEMEVLYNRGTNFVNLFSGKDEKSNTYKMVLKEVTEKNENFFAENIALDLATIANRNIKPSATFPPSLNKKEEDGYVKGENILHTLDLALPKKKVLSQ